MRKKVVVGKSARFRTKYTGTYPLKLDFIPVARRTHSPIAIKILWYHIWSFGTLYSRQYLLLVAAEIATL
jgi:hypothetical protein